MAGGARAIGPIAVTMGEPAGIGGEITLRAWQARTPATPPFFVIDDPGRLSAHAHELGLTAALHAIADPEDALDVFERALPVLPIQLEAPAVPGLPDTRNNPATLAAIEVAVRLARDGAAAAMVTNPIHKATLYATGFGFPGHTEYLGKLVDIEDDPVMMLAGPSLKVVPVTVHMALASALASLSTDRIVYAAAVTDAALRRDFGIASPRLAIAGLNPHAGEGGTLGHEEEEIIRPAIERLRTAGIAANGPYSPDGMFHASAREGYDAAICMYHDQALIPLKTLDFDLGVNVTLGLPIVRTSPDHGTALDIAGRGLARETSLVAAIRLAAEIARRRAAHG